MTLRRNGAKARPGEEGFSLVETMVGAGILGLVVATLATGMTFGFRLVELNSENLRATEILTEKMDLIRACNWTQLTNGYSVIPSTFTAPFYAAAITNGPTFQGAVSITPTPVTESYSNNLRQITVTVTWTSANVTRSRSMTTFASPYGIQNYSF